MTSPDACNERYSELAALAVTGSLSDIEASELRTHISQCAQCARFIADFGDFISDDMAPLAAGFANMEELSATVHSWSRAEVKKKLMAQVGRRAVLALELGPGHVPPPANSRSCRWLKALRVSAIAATFLLAVALSYQIGFRQASVQTVNVHSDVVPRRAPTPTASMPISPELASARMELTKLQQELRESNSAIQRAVTKVANNEAQIVELRAKEVLLDQDASRFAGENGTQAKRIEALSAEKADLQQQLENTRTLLQHANLDLENARQDRQRALLRTASLETELSTLNGRLRLMDSTTTQDRDIRELMGARQLYIADVFDVNQDGKSSKAFGRVFYTKGKSLVFYAFDLDRQPGVREAKAFQAWGRSDGSRSSAVSLGIFYLDSEANRRWVLKAEDPDTLAQISAVFVTTEPTGGSKRPSGKPFLFAYLRSLPPNHP